MDRLTVTLQDGGQIGGKGVIIYVGCTTHLQRRLHAWGETNAAMFYLFKLVSRPHFSLSLIQTNTSKSLDYIIRCSIQFLRKLLIKWSGSRPV